MSGWIKTHRSLINHWCASDPNFLAVWIRLLFDANFETGKTMVNGTPVTILRGQLLFGLPSFAKRSGVTVSRLRRVISVLIEEKMISRQTTNKYSIISITKYDQYQSDDRQNTGRAQAKHRQTTTSKELNNINNKTKAKKIKCPEYWQPSDEVFIWATEHGLSNYEVNLEIDKFVAFFTEGNGAGTKRPGWDVSFKSWIRKHQNYSPEEIKFKSQKQEDAENLDRYLEYYKKNNHWIMEWGFGPDDFRCTIPHEILTQHGIPLPPATK